MADGRRDKRNRAVAGIHLMLMWLTEVKTRPTYVRRIVRDVLAASVGFGLGVSYSRTGGMAPDLTNLPAEEQRTEQSSAVSSTTWTDGPWLFAVDRGELTCIGPVDDPGVFLVTDNGEMFALNPAAIRMADRVGAMSGPGPDLAEPSATSSVRRRMCRR